MGAPSPPTPTELFAGLQKGLCATLEANREVLHHAVTKGDASELKWIEMLAAHLPNRYELARASVIDADGRASECIDIVIFDRQYTPKLFNRDGAIFLPAESVYAAIEVKQSLTKEQLEYASQKVASVRRLRRTSIVIPHAGGEHPPKPLPKIVGALVCLKSGWNPAFGQAFSDCLNALPLEGGIDLGCALADGAFSVDDTRQVRIVDAEFALASFFVTLFSRLQAMATVPAIDLGAYAPAALAGRTI
jgi:hypothetical protein